MVEYSARTLTALLKNTVSHSPNRIAISCEGAEFSYAELDHASDAWAAFFHTQGLKLGERVAVILPNLPQFPIVFFGILKAGGVAVHLNPLYTSTELKDHLQDSGARFVIALNSVLPTLQPALPLPSIEHIILASPGDFLNWNAKLYDWINGLLHSVDLTKLEHQYPCRWWSFLQAQNDGEQHRYEQLFHDANPEDLAVIQYTAGTISASKGVMLCHKNLLESTLQALERAVPVFETKLECPVEMVPLTSVVAIPLYHILGLTAGLLAIIALGGCARLVPDPRSNTMLIRALSQPFHSIVGVTTLLHKLMGLKEFSEISFESLCLTCSGGMVLPISIADRWTLITGAPILQGYGLTETAAALTLSTPLEQGNSLTYHSGKPLRRTEMQIRHAERAWIHPLEVGEIWVRGPQVMSGYWNRPEETRACFDAEGWFNTGDLGFWDAEGHLHWVDRKKDVVDVSGFKVWPSEIEIIALTFPGVREAVAYGVPHLHQGECVHLALTFHTPPTDANFSVDSFLRHCQRHLAAYKIPSCLIHYTSLPRNSIGKIRRVVLQDHAIQGYPSHIAQCRVLTHNEDVV